MGGGGHVGLPLSIVFAGKGKKVRIFDINRKTIDTVMSGQMPFMEKGAEPMLKDVLFKGILDADSVPECIRAVPVVIITIGTPSMSSSIRRSKRFTAASTSWFHSSPTIN
jgi:UDP-N-acetyl-D-mannosaminuronic acid dehydrogenase